MKWVKTGVAALAALGFATPAGAADVEASLGVAAEYDSNVGRRDGQELDDFIFYITPGVHFLETDGNLNWDLRYRAPYEHAIDTSRINGFRHFGQGELKYHWGEHTIFTINDRLIYTEAVTSELSLEDPDEPLLGTEREPILRNQLRLGIDHLFSPRPRGYLGFSYRIFDSDIAVRANNAVYAGDGSLSYLLNPRHRVGAGASFAYHDFDESNNGIRPPSQTIFATVSGLWDWMIDETTNLSVRMGPTLIDSQQEAPPGQVLMAQPLIPFRRGVAFDPEANAFVSGIFVLDRTQCDMSAGLPVTPCAEGFLRDTGTAAEQADIDLIENQVNQDANLAVQPINVEDTVWTLFGDVTLSKRWTPDVTSSLSYRREDNTASGVAGSAVLDIVTATTGWRLSDLWRLDFLGQFTRRESATASVQSFLGVDDGATQGQMIVLNSNAAFPLAHSANIINTTRSTQVDTIRWGVSGRLQRRLTRRITTMVRYSYNRQESGGNTAGRSSDFDNHLVTIGVQYITDRLTLW